MTIRPRRRTGARSVARARRTWSTSATDAELGRPRRRGDTASAASRRRRPAAHARRSVTRRPGGSASRSTCCASSADGRRLVAVAHVVARGRYVVARADRRGDERRPHRAVGRRPAGPPERRASSTSSRSTRRWACAPAGRRGGGCRPARTCPHPAIHIARDDRRGRGRSTGPLRLWVDGVDAGHRTLARASPSSPTAPSVYI